MIPLLDNPAELQAHIQQVSGEILLQDPIFPGHLDDVRDASAVMFLLGPMITDNGQQPEPVLILNKRSQKVTQPGDLCCPGGGIAPVLDALMSRVIALPGFPMWRWPAWKAVRDLNANQARIMQILFSTCLRESYEEMRLKPLGVRFLGPLPIQRLVMFGRIIYPMMAWVSKQHEFKLNWEVEKIVTIPLRKLLAVDNYVQYQLFMTDASTSSTPQLVYDAPSFLHQNGNETEVLWGATCRITLNFLELMFDFELPTDISLPVLKGTMQATYMQNDNGKRA